MRNKSHLSSIDASLIMFWTSLVILTFLFGLLAAANNWFPYPSFKKYVDEIKILYKEVGTLTLTSPDYQLVASKYEGEGVVKNMNNLISPGLTLFTSFYDDSLEIRLIEQDGKVVNRWPVSYSAIWGDSDNIPPHERPRTDWDAIFNGVHLEPDGSIVFPLGGLVKIDRCAQVVWKIPRKFHHSIEKSPRGTYWVPAREYISEYSKHMPIRTPYELDTAVEVSSDGEILREIPILDLLWSNDMLATLFANNRNFDPNPVHDVIHLNDIEEIPTELLQAFPMFAEGDLLASLRQSNLLIVFSPETLEIKWFHTGPWIQQHDGDWQADGTITVFDNRFDGTTTGIYFGGSNIIAIDPHTNAIKYLYGANVDEFFYSQAVGDHQVLPNGNILITESMAGRVIEVTPKGKIVWEYINRYSDEKTLKISDAIRYPSEYLDVADWGCE